MVHVFLRDDDGAWRRLEWKTADADDGAFLVRGLARGRYRLALSEEGEAVLREIDVSGSGEQVLDLGLPR
jgi:hypothetical protein